MSGTKMMSLVLDELTYFCRLRMAREKSSSSFMAKSGTSCEIPESESPSKVIKKSEIMGRNSSSGSEKFGAIDKKETVEIDDPEKTVHLIGDFSVRKVNRKLSKKKNVQIGLESPTRSSRRNSSKNESKSSFCSNGVSSGNSMTSESNGLVASEKSPNIPSEAIGETATIPCVVGDSLSEKPEAEHTTEDRLKKASRKVAVGNIKNEDVRLGS